MSFLEQERALLDLLFDANLRARFVQQRERALVAYDLSESERADFANVRVDALDLDAQMRVDLILQRMCRALPVSISISSSLPGGLAHLRSLVDANYIRTSSEDRATYLGQRLRSWLSAAEFASSLEHAASVAVCDAELSMTTTAAALRRAVLSETDLPELASLTARPHHWHDKAIKLAPYVSVAMLPQGYSALKRALCPVSDRLSSTPLPVSRRSQTLAQESPRLVVMRAYVKKQSRCELTVDHRTLELSGGFAPLFAHVNGKASLDDLTRELVRAGATERVCQGVRAGFAELFEHGMLVTAL